MVHMITAILLKSNRKYEKGCLDSAAFKVRERSSSSQLGAPLAPHWSAELAAGCGPSFRTGCSSPGCKGGSPLKRLKPFEALHLNDDFLKRQKEATETLTISHFVAHRHRIVFSLIDLGGRIVFPPFNVPFLCYLFY